MYTFIVSWFLVSTQATSCPDLLKPNAFGVYQNASISCLVLHTQTKETKFTKEYKNKKEALIFLDSIQKYKTYQNQGLQMLGAQKVDRIKLDSLK